MNPGTDIAYLANELKRQLVAKKDFLADTPALKMLPPASALESLGADMTEPTIVGLESAPMPLTDHAHGQLASELEIPKRYYDKMRVEAPELLAQNVNAWFQKTPQKKLIRTLDGRVRSVLTNAFRTLDNFDLMEAVLPVFLQNGAQVVSSALTERRMYLKVIYPHLCSDVPEGVQLGMGNNFRPKDKPMIIASSIVSNSEVGAGALSFEYGVFETWCTNLAIASDASMRKFHLGRRQEVEGVRALLSDETKRADDKALWLTVRDLATNAASPEAFTRQIALIKAASEQQVPARDVSKVIEVITEKYSISETVGASIMEHLIGGGDLSQWGLVQAITRTAGDVEDYDASTDLERTGGQVLALEPHDFAKTLELARAA